MDSMNNLKIGCGGRVCGMTTRGSMRRRLQDIGLVNGTYVRCLQKSFSGDPAAYLIRDAVIALRNEDAATIIIDDTQQVSIYGSDKILYGQGGG